MQCVREVNLDAEKVCNICSTLIISYICLIGLLCVLESRFCYINYPRHRANCREFSSQEMFLKKLKLYNDYQTNIIYHE